MNKCPNSALDSLNTGIPMKPDDFVGPNFFPSIFKVIKHPEYLIVFIPDTWQLLQPKLLDSM